MGFMVKDPALETAWDALSRGDDETAEKQFQALAEEGNPAAQTNLGIMYEAGIGTETSDSQAEYWYRRAAEAGLRDGQYQLGAILAADMLRGIMAKKVDEQNFSERVLE